MFQYLSYVATEASTSPLINNSLWLPRQTARRDTETWVWRLTWAPADHGCEATSGRVSTVTCQQWSPWHCPNATEETKQPGMISPSAAQVQ